MTPPSCRSLAAAGVLAAALAGAAGTTAAQTADPAPYLHTQAHPAARHAVARKKLVPVLTPHHAGSPRHAPRQAAAKPPPPKPAASPPAVVAQKPAPPPPPADIGANSGLKLPRYAALKSDEVNMRSGPGERYPVLWTYQRRDLPVKIEHEFDIWRQVEDMDGIKGWMQEGFLVGHRSFVVTGTDDRVLRADAAESADPVAILKPGVVGRIRVCEAAKDWCQVQVQDYRGWLRRTDLWGTDPGEVILP